MIRVTLAQAIHFVLQKNYLGTTKASNIIRLTGDVVGLVGNPVFTPFVSAYVRLIDLTSHHFLAELYQNHNLIENTLMRGLSYIVPADNYVSLYAATARQRKQNFNSEFRQWGLENDEAEVLGQAIIEVIDNQPTEAETIIAGLPQNLIKELTQTSRGGRITKVNNVDLVLRWLIAEGKLCAGQTVADASQAWHTKKLVYAPLSYWYPDLDLTSLPTEAEAQAALVRAYLAAFGPATEADISAWTGFGKSETARAVGALTSETTLTMIEGLPGMLLLLRDQVDNLSATQPSKSPIINVLPPNDIFVIAHRASQLRLFGDQSLRRRIFNNFGEAQPAIVIDGQIVGTWTWFSKDNQNKLTWRLLTEVDPTLRPLIQAEVERVSDFIHPTASVVQETD